MPAYFADEAIAQAVHGGNVTRVPVRVAQGVAQLRDRPTHRSGSHMAVTPHNVEQGGLADHRARLFQQRDQHGICFWFHRNRVSAPMQLVRVWYDDDIVALINFALAGRRKWYRRDHDHVPSLTLSQDFTARQRWLPFGRMA